MSTVSAAIRLREKVSSVPGTCLIISAGHPDKIIKFQVLPKSLEKLFFDNAAAQGIKTSKVLYPVTINLDKGPDQEAWNASKREFFLSARRDRPVPEPLPVSEDSHTDWSVDEEDVPVIENAIVSADAKIEASTTCETCTVPFKTEHALKIHKARAKH